MTTELTTTEQHLPSTDVRQGAGGEFDNSDLAIPYVKIIHAQSDEGTPGHFLASDGTEYEFINLVVLHIQATRTFFDPDAMKIICKSNDRRTGWPTDLADFAEPGQPLACNQCPHFNDDQFQKFACKKDYVLTCFNLDTEEPFTYRVKGAATGMFKYRVISAVVMGRKAPWSTAFQMTGVKRVNDRKQSWWAPELKPIEQYDEDTQERWAKYAAQFGGGITDHEEHIVDLDDLPFE